MSENPLKLLMNPRSIAWVGASNNPEKMGSIQVLNFLKTGYKGRFYPIHPKEENIFGRKAYPSPDSLPEAPDLAVIIIAKQHVAPLLELFGKKGTRRAVIITAGFKETGAEGKSAEDDLNRVAEKYGIRFVGPNCIGVINTQAALNTTLVQHSLGPGPLGLASQSGTYVTQTLRYISEKGIRLSKAMSLGNEANISIVDALEYLGQDDDTKAIILYIEGIREGRRFIEVAKRITPRKPVLALYVGGSEAGARAGMSHTGALAGPDYLYDGIFKQAGIIRVNSIEDLYEQGWAFAVQPPMKGNMIGVISNSGGPASSISHAANKEGLEMPVFSPKLQAEIRNVIVGHAASANPVDMTFDLDMKKLSTTIPEIILKSGEVDGLIIHGVIDLSIMMTNVDLSRAVKLPEIYQKPVFISSFFDRADKYTAYYEDHGIPVFEGPEKAARGMANFFRYSKIQQGKTSETLELPEPSREADSLITAALGRGQTALDEYEGKRLLSAYGIPVTREQLVLREGEAIRAAGDIGYPVVLKGCSWKIMHKTGKGLIHLGLKSEEEVAKAFRIIKSSGHSAADEDMPVLVQEMILGSREFVAGMTRFPGFGPVLLFGLGGIFTEALKDAAFRSAPLGMIEAAEMVRDIRASSLLGEFRGMPAVNVNVLAEILQKLGFIAMLHPEISEMDLNPIIISRDAPVVADALLVLRKPG